MSRPTLRIAHVTATFPPYWAGTGNVAYHNARVLHERGHDVTVFTASTERDDELSFPFEVVRLAAPLRIGNAPLTPALPARLAGFDLVHLHVPYIFGAELTALTRLLRGTPLAMTYHNDLLATGARGRLFRLYSQLNQRWLLRKADRLIATSSDYARHSLLARTAPDLGAVEVVANGVDTDAFRPEPATPSWRGELGIPEGAPVALFVGGLDPAHHFKGVHVLLEAMERLPDAHLVAVGEGSLREGYRAQAEASSPGRVHFVGKVPLERLISFYQGASLTVLPSVTQGEAFGMVLIESMACGTPVVASDLPGVRSVVTKDVGYLAAPGDPDDLAGALSSLLDDPEQARRMGAAGRELVRRRYNWEVVVDDLEAIYRDMLAGQPHTAPAL
jgi:glycosyltransferase involved in cell wall biosynthesis